MDERVIVPVVVLPFPGTEAERRALTAAMARFCACAFEGQPAVTPCAAHQLLIGPTLKRLVFYRRWRRALRRAEWLKDPCWLNPRP